VNEQRTAIGHMKGGIPNPWTADKSASVKRIALFHYCTKSLEDFRIKSSRAGGNNPVGKPLKFFESMQKCASAPCMSNAVSPSSTKPVWLLFGESPAHFPLISQSKVHSDISHENV
jgi:hypothetical protein